MTSRVKKKDLSMFRSIKFGLLALAAVYASPAVSFAAMFRYDITVVVSAAPNSPGSFPSNPWSFSSVPALFAGTFDADDAAVGPISNFALVIGGLDIATSHPNGVNNLFDPSTLTLDWLNFNQAGLESAVVFGPFNGSPQPTNYAAAIQNTFFSPLDPFLGNTQNWVGTYAVAPSAAVPEPASLTMFGLGAVGLVAGAIRRRRQAKAAV